MFSERFSVREKYNLLTQEHVATCERMPVRYTSLTDGRYGPVIDEDVKNSINLYRYYKPQHTTDPHEDHDNDLFIEYKDGVINSYFLKKFMRLCVLKQSPSLWNGFLNKIECQELDKCVDEAERICSVTDEHDTMINGIEYNADGSFSGVRITDYDFNLVDYTENDDYVERINKLTVRNPTGNYAALSSVTLYPDSDYLKYTVNFMYPSFMDESYKGKDRVNRMYNMKPELVNTYIDAMTREGGLGLLTQEQGDFIKSLCVGDSHFNLSWLIYKTGEVKDIFVYHHTVSDFKDLTTS